MEGARCIRSNPCLRLSLHLLVRDADVVAGVVGVVRRLRLRPGRVALLLAPGGDVAAEEGGGGGCMIVRVYSTLVLYSEGYCRSFSGCAY